MTSDASRPGECVPDRGDPERLASALRRGLTIWAMLSLLGVGIVALPDAGERIVSFSEGHGPSLMDSAGIVLLMAGWFAFIPALWRARPASRRGRAIAGLALTGAGVVVWSVATDSGRWWVVGSGALVVTQGVAALSALRRLQGRPIGRT